MDDVLCGESIRFFHLVNVFKMRCRVFLWFLCVFAAEHRDDLFYKPHLTLYSDICTLTASPTAQTTNPNATCSVHGLINGHFTGHLLSALAFTAAGTLSAQDIRVKGAKLVSELAICQAAMAKKFPDRDGTWMCMNEFWLANVFHKLTEYSHHQAGFPHTR